MFVGCFGFVSIITIMLPCLFIYTWDHFHCRLVGCVNSGFVWGLMHPDSYSDHIMIHKKDIETQKYV